MICVAALGLFWDALIVLILPRFSRGRAIEATYIHIPVSKRHRYMIMRKKITHLKFSSSMEVVRFLGKRRLSKFVFQSWLNKLTKCDNALAS